MRDVEFVPAWYARRQERKLLFRSLLPWAAGFVALAILIGVAVAARASGKHRVDDTASASAAVTLRVMPAPDRKSVPGKADE